MIIRTPREQIDAYYSFEAINQSSLKKLISGVQAFNEERLELMTSKEVYEEKDYFVIGQAVDTIMTEGIEQFYKDHHISTLEKKPSDTLKKILFMLLSNLNLIGIKPNELDQHQELLHGAINTVPGKDDKGNPTIGYFMNRAKDKAGNWIPWQDDKRVVSILEDQVCLDYWQDIVTANGKQVLTTEEYSIVRAICDSFVEHPFTKGEFEDSERIIHLYQQPLYFEVGREQCKALPDKLKFDLNRRTIQIQDIKTMYGYVANFPKAAEKRRYDLQGAFYTQAVQANLVTLSSIIGHDVTNFHLEGVEFIVQSTTKIHCPMIFSLSSDILRQGTMGATKNDIEIKGFRTLLNEYIYWKGFDFDIAKGLQAVNGKIVIFDNYKTLLT